MNRNEVVLQGFLGADPTARHLPSGTVVVNARLSTHYKPSADAAEEVTEWHSLVFMGAQAEVAQTYAKGMNLHVEGTIRSRTWKAEDESQRRVYEILVYRSHQIAPLGQRRSATSAEQGPQPARKPAATARPPTPAAAAQAPRDDSGADDDYNMPRLS